MKQASNTDLLFDHSGVPLAQPQVVDLTNCRCGMAVVLQGPQQLAGLETFTLRVHTALTGNAKLSIAAQL